MGTVGRPEKELRVTDGALPPLGTRIRLLRRAKGMTATDLAYELGITRQHMSKIELGDDHPSGKLLEAICRELAISPKELQDDSAWHAHPAGEGAEPRGQESGSALIPGHPGTQAPEDSIASREWGEAPPMARQSAAYDSPLSVSPHRILIGLLASTEEHLAAALQSLRGARQALEELLDEDEP